MGKHNARLARHGWTANCSQILAAGDISSLGKARPTTPTRPNSTDANARPLTVAQLAHEADALIVVANAAEADDLAWAMLASEVRKLRGARPILVVLNRRDVAERACTPLAEAVNLLDLREDAPGVHVETIASSTDIAGVEAGLSWLCEELTDSGETADASAAALLAAPTPMAPDSGVEVSSAQGELHGGGGRARLRVIRALRDARHFNGEEEDDIADLQQRLMAGHILSEAELERIRAANRGAE
jgi:hypothetical protein